MNSNTNYKPTEGKREEFRKYLEKTGVMDALTKVLVSLYEEPEKPEDALTYIQDKLAIQSGSETADSLKAQLTEARTKIEELESENAALKGVGGDAAEPTEPALEEDAAPAPAPEENLEVEGAPDAAPIPEEPVD